MIGYAFPATGAIVLAVAPVDGRTQDYLVLARHPLQRERGRYAVNATTSALVLIEGAHGTRGEWEFDTDSDDTSSAELTPAQHTAAVRIVQQPENADCERGVDCVNQRPTLMVGGEVRKRGADFIGFHLAEDPDTGYERMRFKPFYVTAAGGAICEECAESGPVTADDEGAST